MARAISTDPFHAFRFAPQIGFEGKPLSASRVVIIPGTPWPGPGVIKISAGFHLDDEFIEFAKTTAPSQLVVGVYHATDAFGPGGTPSLWIVLDDVTPANGSMLLGMLDAASSEVFAVELTMQYDRLNFIFGDCPLAKIAAVV